MQMVVTFPKSRDRRPAVFEWADGLVATTPLRSRGTSLPHDLGHFPVEATFRPPYGFWTLAARQAPFASLTLVRGRWPKGRREWLDRVRRKHGAEMLKAEAVGAMEWIGDPALDLDAVWAEKARVLRKAYALAPHNPYANATKADFVELRARHLKVAAAWRRVPMGGALVVEWPPEAKPRAVAAYEHPAA